MSETPRRPAVSTRYELVVVVALLAVPVAVVPAATGDPTLVSLWGLINTGVRSSATGLRLYPMWTYFADQPRSFGSLPASIRAWPLSVVFHLCAAASAGSGVAFGREDRRVTGGLLLLAAFASLWVGVGLAERFGVGTASGWFTVLPLGAVATATVVAVVYRTDLRSVFVRP